MLRSCMAGRVFTSRASTYSNARQSGPRAPITARTRGTPRPFAEVAHGSAGRERPCPPVVRRADSCPMTGQLSAAAGVFSKIARQWPG
jgi:hypothetical protein